MTDPVVPPLVPDRIAATAVAAPASIAIVNDSQTVTYSQLVSSARRFAARLRRAGVRPGDHVGVNLRRSPEAVIAMLGTWFAGAAYVPFPVDYPGNRLQFMLADSGARHVVTGEEGATFAHDAENLVYDGAGGEPGAARPARPGEVAYLIYTSGSTGTPKGVSVTHRGIANLVHPGQSYVRFAPGETFLQLAPLAFDASAFEIWGALANGARLVLTATTSYQAIDELPGTLREHRVSTLLLTPSLFHALMSSRPEALDPVSRLIVGGDAMSAQWASAFTERARAQGAARSLHNVYGPTEATTLVSAHPMADVPADARQLPIGPPIDGAALYLLDEGLGPVPPGATGQIYIGGTAVARGYHGQPRLTADRFLPDPYGSEPGARMYATGDLGTMGEDGIIRFAGRADNQVKVRGHRVEPQEVEYVLEQHPDVRHACVVLAGDLLVAHLVTEGGTDEVDKHARAVLPGYMVPAHYVRHDALPIGPTGKVDRSALAAVVPSDGGQFGSVTGSVSAEEAALIEIWRQVLGRDDIGPEDDFFALGGDSIAAISVVGEGEDRGMPVSIQLLFAKRTVRGVCAEFAGPPDPAPLTAEAKSFPASQTQLGLVYECMRSDGEHYVDVVSREVDAPFDEDALRRAVQFVTDRHELLRSRFDLAAPDQPAVVVEPQVTPLLTIGGDGPADRMHEPFDVETAPLIRFHAQPLPRGFRLSYAFHHAIVDGWSESVLALELMERYRGELAGVPVEPPPVPSYAEFVRLEAESRTDPGIRGVLRALAAELPHGPASTEPTSPEPAAAEQPQRERAIVPITVLGQLRARGADWKLPMKSLLSAATGRALATLAGSRDALFWMSVSGRPELPGADRMVGFFLNWLPVVVPDAGWQDAARSSFENEMRLLPARRFPYPDLKEVLGPVPMEVAFNYVRFRLADELRELGVKVTRDDAYDRTSLPVLVEFHEEPDSLAIDVRADPGRYEPGFAARLLSLVTASVNDLAMH